MSPFPLVAAGLGVAAFLLRLYQSGAQELWLDEALSFHRATIHGGWRPDTVGDYSPPLYYLLLHGWITLAGSTEAGLRLLSVLAGTLGVLAVIWAGRAVLTPAVGLWSGLFAAVAPLHIYYSQEARPYALVTMLLALTYALLWRAMERNTWPAWLLVAAAAVLALHTHYFAVLALLPTVLLPILWPDSHAARARWMRYGATAALCAVLYLPWLWWSFVLNPRSVVVLDWMQDLWAKTPPALAIPKAAELLGLGSQAGGVPLHLKQFSTLVFPPALRVVGLVLLLVLGVWAVGPWGDQRLALPWLIRRKLWLVAMLVIPLIVLSLISLVRPVYVVGRYDMIVFPAYALLVGLGLAKAHAVPRAGPWLAGCLATILLLVIGAKLTLYYHAPPRHQQEVTARTLHSSVRNGDVVVFTGLRGLPTLYYLNRHGYQWREGHCEDASGRRFGCRMFPLETEGAPSIYNTRRVAASFDAVGDDLTVFLQGLQGPGSTLWVVFNQASPSPAGWEFPEPDASLVRQLARRGLLPPRRVDEALRIFQFGPSSPQRRP